MHHDRSSAKEKKRKSKGLRNHKARRSSLRRILRCEALEDRRLLAGDLNIVAFTPTPSGFVVDFNQPVDPNVLNLYDAASGGLGPADLSLVGATTGPVQGSALLEGNRLRFVATGGALGQDTYTARVRSAENGLRALDGGALLDGDFTGAFPSGDGSPGGDFVFSFTAAPEAIVVGMPDFARGPAQSVNVRGALDEQASHQGLPIQISDAGGVTSVMLQVTYNPALLQITDVELGIDAPLGSQVVVNLNEPGEATVAFFALDPLPDGPASIFTLIGNVPRSAPYGEAQSIRITQLELNAGALAATADEAVHVVAFPGDANRNMRYDAEDARLIARTGVGLDSGFALDPPHANPVTPLRTLYPTIDATIIGDVTGDGTLSALDASDVLRKVVGLPTPGLPDLPENAAPLSIALSPDSLPENEPVGTVVGLLSTVDPDEDDTHTYQLVAGPGSEDNAFFTIDGATLKTAAVLDFESQSLYQIRVRSTDALGLSVEQTLQVSVTDVNEAPSAVLLTPDNVPENSPIGTVVGVLSSVDPDAGDTHTYSLVEGEGDDDNAAFVIDGDQLKTAAELDYETKNSYLIRVRSTDSGGLSVEQTLVVMVTDVNEAPTAVALSPDSVPENVEIGTVVGIFTTDDPDAGDTHQYSLVDGDGDDDNAAFLIDGDRLRTATELDYETKNTYLIRVRSTDSGGLSVEQMLMVTVTDVNEAPTAVTLSAHSVPENVEIGTVVGEFSTEDPDAGDTHEYSLVEGDDDDDNGAFVIDGNQLKTAVELDYETKNTYLIRVRSTDAGGLSVEQVLVISVLDVNEAPTAVLLAPNSVSQNMNVGDVIGQFTTIDPDAGDTHTYSFAEGDGDADNAWFEIDGNQLRLAAELDLSQTTYQIRVRSTDAGGLSVEQTLLIVANEAPTGVSLSPDSVPENVEIGTVVGEFSTEDPDAGDTHEYRLVEGDGDDDNATFVIDGNQLKTAAELDYETKNTYLIRVRSTDSGGLSVEQMLVVTVTDVNEAPTAVTLSPDSVPENVEIGTVVGEFSTEDPDAGDTHEYSLVEGDDDDDNAAFVIDGNQLKTAVELDYETKNTYLIRVRSTDAGGLSVEQVLVISVLDVNEAPTAVLLTPSSVSQNMNVGDVIGQFTTIDPDAGDAHTYGFAEGDGDADNAWFEIDGNQLRLAAELDLSQTTYQIRVRSTDAGGLSVEQTLLIVANEAPTEVSLSPDFVPENVEIGTVVGEFSTEDPDAGDTHEYSLAAGDGDDDNAAFVIDGNQLKTAVELDYETKNTYLVRVRSTDSGGLSVEQVFVISVLDVNESPTAVLLTPSSVSQNMDVGDVIGQLTTIDPDAGDAHTYTLVEGDGDADNAWFDIDGSQLRLAAELDPAQTTYQIRVRSTDAGDLSVEQTLLIVANEAPTEVSLSPDFVPENIEIGTVVGVFTTDDPDAGDTHQYSLVQGDGDDDNAAFVIDGDQLKTAVELDYETKNTYLIRVRSTDSGGLSVEQMLVVTVTDVNEAPTAVTLSPDSVPENVEIGSVVGVFATDDPDAGDTHEYTLVQGDGDDDNEAFVIDGDQLKTAVELDYETKNTYLIRVRSTDSGGLSVEQMLVVTVTDVNEAPTAVTLSPDSVLENAEIGSVVGILATDDPDAGDTHEYSLVEGDGDDDNGAFLIDGDELKTTVELDHATKDTYLIRVRSNDSGGLSVEQMLVVTVTVNEAPTAVTLAPDSVPENVEIGSVVGVFTTDDPNAGDTHEYSLVEGDGDDDNGAFVIDGDELKTAVELDYETKNTYLIRVRSTDSGGLSVEQMLMISVLNVNEAPVNHVPDSQTTGIGIPLTFSLAGGNAIAVSDVDAGDDDLTIQLTAENGSLDRTEFTGSLDQLNAWLDGLIFTPETDFVGDAFLDILTNDLGHNGLGGPQTASSRIAIAVQ
jgi:methyl coenzyme M reductase gamma subunit